MRSGGRGAVSVLGGGSAWGEGSRQNNNERILRHDGGKKPGARAEKEVISVNQ